MSTLLSVHLARQVAPYEFGPLRCLVGTLYAYATRRSIAGAGFRLASRSAKFFGWIAVIVH